MDVICCECRSELSNGHHYWLGLYKITSQPGDAVYWQGTTWYDDSASAFRAWAEGYPRRMNYDTCIGYTMEGWIDTPCTVEFYFTCKRPPGNSLMSTDQHYFICKNVSNCIAGSRFKELLHTDSMI